MVAHQKVQAVQDGLDTLRDLVDIFKEPQKLVALHEEARRQCVLTETEEKQALEARQLVAKLPALKRDIAEAQGNLESAIEKHAAHVKTVETEQKTKSMQLDDRERKLSEEQKEFGEKLASLAATERQLRADRAAFDDWKKTEELRLNGRQQLLDKMAEHQKQQQIRLDADTAALRNKAARLQQAVAE